MDSLEQAHHTPEVTSKKEKKELIARAIDEYMKTLGFISDEQKVFDEMLKPIYIFLLKKYEADPKLILKIGHKAALHEAFFNLERAEKPPILAKLVKTALTDLYFKTKSFEQGGKIYEKIGVKFIQKIVMGVAVILGIEENPGAYFIGKKRNEEALRKFELGTRVSEAQHIPFSLLFAILLMSDPLLWGTGLIINMYLIILQRYNRSRVTRILNKKYAN